MLVCTMVPFSDTVHLNRRRELTVRAFVQVSPLLFRCLFTSEKSANRLTATRAADREIARRDHGRLRQLFHGWFVFLR